MFLKEVFKKVNFEKYQQTTKKKTENYPECNDLLLFLEGGISTPSLGDTSLLDNSPPIKLEGRDLGFTRSGVFYIKGKCTLKSEKTGVFTEYTILLQT